MFEYRHAAYSLATGEIINANRSNYLKREVARCERFNRKLYNVHSQWRWCHDFGKKWDMQGLPNR